MSKSLKVTKETLTALDQAIVKWKGNVKCFPNILVGVPNCPLCLLNNNWDHGCVGCPISEDTGLSGCEGTPYEGIEEMKRDVDNLAAKEKVAQELEYLEDLRSRCEVKDD